MQSTTGEAGHHGSKTSDRRGDRGADRRHPPASNSPRGKAGRGRVERDFQRIAHNYPGRVAFTCPSAPGGGPPEPGCFRCAALSARGERSLRGARVGRAADGRKRGEPGDQIRYQTAARNTSERNMRPWRNPTAGKRCTCRACSMSRLPGLPIKPPLAGISRSSDCPLVADHRALLEARKRPLRTART